MKSLQKVAKKYLINGEEIFNEVNESKEEIENNQTTEIIQQDANDESIEQQVEEIRQQVNEQMEQAKEQMSQEQKEMFEQAQQMQQQMLQQMQ